jgi:hypothetical protein
METLSLNLHRNFFSQILDGTKKVEYRNRTDYWKRRLKSKKYTHIRFRNGYQTVAPEMLVRLRKLVEKDDCFELHLAEIVEMKNTKLLKK